MKNTDSRFLYKAKRTVNNEWVQGYIFKTGKSYKILPTDFVSPALSVQEDTICQCTGMEDYYYIAEEYNFVSDNERQNSNNQLRPISKTALSEKEYELAFSALELT